MGCFARRLVQAFELTEHLPVRLFALVPNQSDASATNVDADNSDSTVTIVPSKIPARSPKSNTAGNSMLAAFPLGVIRTVNMAGDRPSNVIKLRGAQQFADCVDDIELAALQTFCPSLANHTGDELTVPGFQQIDGKLNLILDKLPPTTTTKSRATDDSSIERLHDWSGSTIRVNPLVTAAQLEAFILRMSAPQW